MRHFEGYEKGVNLGGWLSQCSHTKERYETFITEADFANLASWGLDHVRVPVDYDLLETLEGDIIEEGTDYIQRAIDWCGKYNLNMVLGLHKTAGFSFDKGENEHGFFESDALQERFYRLWERLATHFGKYSDRVCFELLNEVTDKKYCEKWNEVSEICIKKVRAIAPDTYILIGGYWNNCIQALPDLKMPYDDKIVYNYHCYEPLIFTHQGAYWVDNMPDDYRLAYPGTVAQYTVEMEKLGLELADLVTDATVETVGEEYFEMLFSEAVKVAEERNVPLYCGEYGVIDRADLDSTIAWFKAINSVFTKYHIGRAVWNYKEMDFGLSDERVKPIFDELKQYL